MRYISRLRSGPAIIFFLAIDTPMKLAYRWRKTQANRTATARRSIRPFADGFWPESNAATQARIGRGNPFSGRSHIFIENVD